jgi:hypothetical protein
MLPFRHWADCSVHCSTFSNSDAEGIVPVRQTVSLNRLTKPLALELSPLAVDKKLRFILFARNAKYSAYRRAIAETSAAKPAGQRAYLQRSYYAPWQAKGAGPPLQVAPMLDLQTIRPESQCLRHSPAYPTGDRLSMRLSGHLLVKSTTK